MKRENALVASNYLPAFELSAFFKAHGIDAVIVQRFAVQVHPDHVAQAERVMRQYEKDWRADGRYTKGETSDDGTSADRAAD